MIDKQTSPDEQSLPTTIPAPGLSGWQRKWHDVIFEADTPAGKAFDVLLLLLIAISVFTVMLESVGTIQEKWGSQLQIVDWIITILFTIEYAARLACVARPFRFATSFFGIVDLLALLPTYLSLFVQGTHSLSTIRCLRLLRVFRIFKLGDHVAEAQILAVALRRTRTKITVFVSVILCAIVILGTIMYLIERDEPGTGFTSIPISVYWAIVTITTVGYGDIAPKTIAGQSAAALIMLLGYSIIIIPAGVFTAEVLKSRDGAITTQVCPQCSREGHDADADLLQVLQRAALMVAAVARSRDDRNDSKRIRQQPSRATQEQGNDQRARERRYSSIISLTGWTKCGDLPPLVSSAAFFSACFFSLNSKRATRLSD